MKHFLTSIGLVAVLLGTPTLSRAEESDVNTTTAIDFLAGEEQSTLNNPGQIYLLLLMVQWSRPGVPGVSSELIPMKSMAGCESEALRLRGVKWQDVGLDTFCIQEK